eukprot:jgi/Tetstr1/457363/TSEL_043966.t1
MPDEGAESWGWPPLLWLLPVLPAFLGAALEAALGFGSAIVMLAAAQAVLLAGPHAGLPPRLASWEHWKTGITVCQTFLLATCILAANPRAWACRRTLAGVLPPVVAGTLLGDRLQLELPALRLALGLLLAAYAITQLSRLASLCRSSLEEAQPGNSRHAATDDEPADEEAATELSLIGTVGRRSIGGVAQAAPPSGPLTPSGTFATGATVQDGDPCGGDQGDRSGADEAVHMCLEDSLSTTATATAADGARLGWKGWGRVLAAGAASGLLGGLIGMWGPPIIMLLANDPSMTPRQVRATAVCIGAVCCVIRIAALAAHPSPAAAVWPLFVAVAAAAVAGAALGLRCHDALAARRQLFRAALLVLILLCGACLLASTAATTSAS